MLPGQNHQASVVSCRVCKTCSMAFIYSQKHRVYCSVSCRNLGQIENQRIWYRNKNPRDPKVCRICNASIPEKSKRMNICSSNCKQIAERFRSKERQLRDKDRLRNQSRNWWLNNKEKHREINRRSAKKRRSKAGVAKREVARYRARKMKADVFPFSIKDENRMLNRQANRCAYCLEKLTSGNTHLDHVIPLSKGGIHGPSNLVIACGQCNASKSDKFLSIWRYKRT